MGVHRAGRLTVQNGQWTGLSRILWEPSERLAGSHQARHACGHEDVLGLTPQDRGIDSQQMRMIKIPGLELVPPDGRDMKQFNKRDEWGVIRSETDSGKRAVIAATVATVLGQKEGVVHAVATPE